MLPLIPALAIIQTTDVKATLESYTKAVLHYDVAALDRLFAPNYVEVSPLGEVDDREKVLSFYRVPVEQRGPVPTAVDLKDWNIRLLGKTVAVVIFREDLEISGRKMSFRITSVLERKRDQWLLVSNHANGIRTKS